MLQEKKRYMKKQNLKLYLRHMEEMEEERLEYQNFQNSNDDLSMVKNVRIYKQLKSEVYNWHQVLSFVSDFAFIASILIAVYVLISMVLVGYPFFVAMSLTLDG